MFGYTFTPIQLVLMSYCRAITQNFDLEFDLPAEFIIALAILNKLEFSKIQSQFHIDGTSHLIEATRQKSRLICDVYDQKIFDEMIFQGNRSIDDPETATYVERLIVTGHEHIITTLRLYSNLDEYVNYVKQGQTIIQSARNMDYPTLIEIFRNNLIDKGLLIDRLTYSNNPLHRRDILACSEMLNKAIMVFHEMIENDAIAHLNL
ncbi:hypothetical protein VNO80_34887 [Phaseolus coccineus]|uniref:Uncharacterized protein n=1 Tax=Phaseolus coccineus TaxID=3886 RepID=A0AAN9KTP9_PHACN